MNELRARLRANRHRLAFPHARTVLLSHLFTEAAPAIWARNWPDPHESAIDVDRLDPCCDGRTGYFIELFRGHHTAAAAEPA